MSTVFMKYYYATAILITILVIPWMIVNYPQQTDEFLSIAHSVEDQIAGVILSRKPKTIEEIKSRYKPASTHKVRILLVPGHEPGYGGAEYPNLKERDLNIEIATQLEKFLKENGKYEVITARTAVGWNPVIESYFNSNWEEILVWKSMAQQETARLVSIGEMKYVPPPVFHNDAPKNVAARLYGLTKWANENDIDIAIHIHVNDYPGHKWGVPGEHSGFSIYVPDSQLGNSSTTQAVASSVFKRLSRYSPISTLKGEAEGIIEEPELIAVGVNNTSAAASMLIEYGYLYEPQFTNPEVRSHAVSDLAFHTYLGLQDFFGSGNDITRAYDTLLVPRIFNRQMSKDGAKSEDVFALQTALILEGLYPPSNKELTDCPRTGKLGPCTIDAIQRFQKKYGITDESGYVGTKTLQALNRLYSPRAAATPLPTVGK
jgi:N-acetylmuramoyl-L-alanine amidase